MGALISFDKLADVANNLINKLSAGVGWIATRETPHRQAISTYIEEIQNSDINPLTKAALITNAKKTIKEYCNQYNIVGYAIDSLTSTSQPDSIDEDWLAQFMDKARLVSNPEFQMIWGKILAGECDAPGSAPKSLLSTLELLDKKTAEKFMAVASVSVWYIDDGKKEWMPVVLQENFDYYQSVGITYDSLWELTSLGLIKDEFGLGAEFGVKFDNATEIHYHDQTYKIDVNCNIHSGNVVFTEAGKALCASVITEKIDGFFDKYCVPHFEKTKNNQE